MKSKNNYLKEYNNDIEISENYKLLSEFLDGIPENQKIMAKSLIFPAITIALLIYLTTKYAEKIKKDVYEDKNLSKKIKDIINDNNDWGVYIIDDNKNLSAFCMFKKEIFMTKALMNILTEKEQISVCLHEAGHISNMHMVKQMMLRFPIYALILNVLLHSSMPGIYIFILYIVAREIPLIPLARFHEYSADKYASEKGYGEELASSLKKILAKFEKFDVIKCESMLCKLIQKTNQILAEHPDTKKRIEKLLTNVNIIKHKYSLTKLKITSIKLFKNLS